MAAGVCVNIDQTGTTAQTVVAAPGAGYRIRVLGFVLTSSGTGVVSVKGGGTVLSAVVMPGGAVMPPAAGWNMVASENVALTVVCDTAGVVTKGHLTYIVEPL